MRTERMRAHTHNSGGFDASAVLLPFFLRKTFFSSEVPKRTKSESSPTEISLLPVRPPKFYIMLVEFRTCSFPTCEKPHLSRHPSPTTTKTANPSNCPSDRVRPTRSGGCVPTPPATDGQGRPGRQQSGPSPTSLQLLRRWTTGEFPGHRDERSKKRASLLRTERSDAMNNRGSWHRWSMAWLVLKKLRPRFDAFGPNWTEQETSTPSTRDPARLCVVGGTRCGARGEPRSSLDSLVTLPSAERENCTRITLLVTSTTTSFSL